MNYKKIIAEISDGDSDISEWRVRKAARGILNNAGEIALLKVGLNNYHKLPGGGIEKNESKEQAFIREILEETGCECKITDYAGVVIEYRNEFKLVQISYIFKADVIGIPGAPKFMQDELEAGFALEWIALDKAIEKLNTDKADNYEGRLINKRDSAVLNYYKNQS